MLGSEVLAPPVAGVSAAGRGLRAQFPGGGARRHCGGQRRIPSGAVPSGPTLLSPLLA